MKLATDIITAIERAEGLDRISKPVIDVVAKAVQPRQVRNWLSGTPLGHPAHPMLTDVPIGMWTAAAVLDVLGGKRGAPGADLLVKMGVLSALPTAATGLNDLSDTYGPETRVGVVHAAANSSALVMYLLSWRARRRGRRLAGRAWGLLGLGTMTAGGYLGGHLSFGMGTNVNRTAWEHGPEDWTPVLADGDLAAGEHRRVEAGGVALLIWRDGTQLHAISATCSHMGGPLDEGEIKDGCVTCPWHGSVFRLRDGDIVRGPATAPQPVYQTRITDGRIEVRAAP